MDVQNFAGKLLHEPGGEQAHVSGQADEVDFMIPERADDFAIVLFAGLAFRRNDKGSQAALAGGGDAGSVGLVGDDNCDAGVGDAARDYAVGDGDEVGAASGEEDAEGFHELTENIIIQRGDTESRRRPRNQDVYRWSQTVSTR